MKINKLFWMSLLASSVTFSSQLSADVSGTVYHEFPVNSTVANTYGVQDANEPGVVGIDVIVTGDNGATETVQTDVNGNWTTTLGAGAFGATIKVEFSNIPSYLYSSPVNTGSNSTVQFIADGATANLGLHEPSQYTTLNPDIVMPMHVNGDPNGGGTAEPMEGLVTHAYTATGSGAQTTLATTAEVGSTYGLAYQKDTDSLFSAAFLKRHVGLENSIGSIFITTDATGASPSTEYVDLTTIVSTLGTLPARPDVPADINQPSTDAAVYPLIAKIGLGDLDISPDGSKLYTVNLNNKSLITINIGNPAKAAGSITAGDVIETAIPAPVCTLGEWRPFGLGLGRGKLYVGGVCDASSGTTANLESYIYEYDLDTEAFNTSPVLNFPLDFPRLPVNGFNPSLCTSWLPWSDNFSDAFNYESVNHCLPQPILTDIELDTDGSLILGFRDRFGDQVGHINNDPDGNFSVNSQTNGDIYRVFNNNGTFVLESNAVAGGLTGCGQNNGDGPNGGEFYCEDNYAGTHSNTGLGGLGIVHGANEVVSSTMDPFAVYSGGTSWLSNIDGTENSTYQVYATSGQDGTFAKANGLGDLEFLGTGAAPLEIGNRVWDDSNGNGVQDAGEPAIQGVDVTLTCGGLTATATSDANGAWLIQDGDMTGGVNIPRNTSCTISVPLTEPNNGNGITTQLSNTATGNDADPVTGSFTITTGRSGQNNHTYDIGYSSTPPGTSGCTTITNTATITGVTETDTNNTNDSSSIAIQANCTTSTPQVDLRLVKTADKTEVLAGETLTYTLTLRNEGTADGTGVEVSDNLPTGVTYVSNNPSQGSYDSGTGIWIVGDLAIGVTATLEIVVTVN